MTKAVLVQGLKYYIAYLYLRDTNDEFSEDLKCQTLNIEEVVPIVNEDVSSLCQILQVTASTF